MYNRNNSKTTNQIIKSLKLRQRMSISCRVANVTVCGSLIHPPTSQEDSKRAIRKIPCNSNYNVHNNVVVRCNAIN